MRIAITGASGLVGTRTATLLRDRGDEVVPLVRGAATGPGGWDPTTGRLNAPDVDAVVHLAGAGIADGRWTRARKQLLADSRIGPTARLCAGLAAREARPRVLVCASGVGYFGDRGDEELDERSPAGAGYLADLAQRWEAATATAEAAGIRVVLLRIGMVLAREGGALPRMLPPFRLGLGGRLGSGRQWVSWIALHDLARVIAFAIDRQELRGPVLAVAPEPARNRDFTRALGRALGRPTILPAPAFALRLALGEMADGLLLASQRAAPRALLEAGFRFDHERLEPTLAALCRPGDAR